MPAILYFLTWDWRRQLFGPEADDVEDEVEERVDSGEDYEGDDDAGCIHVSVHESKQLLSRRNVGDAPDKPAKQENRRVRDPIIGFVLTQGAFLMKTLTVDPR